MKQKNTHRAIRGKTNVQSLAKHVELLPVFEFSNVVNASYDLQFILSTVLRTLMGKFVISRGMVFLKKGTDYTVFCVKGISDSIVGTTVVLSHPPKKAVFGWMPQAKKSSWQQILVRHRQRIIVPIQIQGECIGIVTLGERHGRKKSFTKQERELILSLVNLSASAIEKARVIGELDTTNKMLARRVQELNTLFELSREFNIGLDAERVLRLLTFALLGQMGVQQYALCLFTKSGLKIADKKGIEGENLLENLHTLSHFDMPVSVTELVQHRQYRASAAELLRRGVAALIPMRVQNTTKGLICLGKNVRGIAYTKEELEFLFSLASLATIAIDNAHLLEEAIEKHRIEDELHIARDIQQGLLPAQLPAISAFECAALNIPSKEVGGDYYDVIPLTESEYLFAIGDVAGKGMPASLLMANVQAALRALASFCTSTSNTVARVNEVVCSNIRSGNKFITFFVGLLNIKTLQLLYTNAGHNPPLVVHSDGTFTRLSEGGLILGVFPNTAYEERMMKLSSGDVVVFYTDGISEAMNEEGNEFTEEQLEQLIKKTRHRSAKEILAAIQNAVAQHVRQFPQSDDITLLVLKFR